MTFFIVTSVILLLASAYLGMRLYQLGTKLFTALLKIIVLEDELDQTKRDLTAAMRDRD